MVTIDLNADLGEGFGPSRCGDDEAMLAIVTSANVACGFHGGDPDVMAHTFRIAKAAVEARRAQAQLLEGPIGVEPLIRSEFSSEFLLGLNLVDGVVGTTECGQADTCERCAMPPCWRRHRSHINHWSTTSRRSRAMSFQRSKSLTTPLPIDSGRRSDCGEVACSRRAALASGGALVAGGIAAIMSPDAPAAADQSLARQPKLVSSDYWTVKERDGAQIRLAMYRKHLEEPTPDGSPRPVLFLVHGSSISARPSFDLSVPGRGDYSLMNALAYRGFDVWTMDHENYGRSSRTDGNSDIASGVEDLRAATQIVAHETGQPRLHLLGESSGALRAGAFASAEPDRVARLVLEAFTWTGRGSPTLGKRAEQLDFFRTHNMRPRDREMIRSIFTRDKAGTSDPAVADALADAELQYGQSVPTGTYLDMTANLPLVDPIKVHAPVLLIRGEHDGIATLDDLLNFFKALPHPDRQFAIIPGAAHALTMSLNRQAFWHTVYAFLTLPQSTAA